MELAHLVFWKVILLATIASVSARSFKKHNKDPLSVIPLPEPTPNIDTNDFVPVKPLKIKPAKLAQENYTPIKSTSKVRRDAYGKSWSSYAQGPPPYLVFNRKIGAYYPYYSFPNSLRRSYMARKYGKELERRDRLAGV